MRRVRRRAIPNPHPPGEPDGSMAPKESHMGDLDVPIVEIRSDPPGAATGRPPARPPSGLGGLLLLALGRAGAASGLAGGTGRGGGVARAAVLRGLLALPAVVGRVKPGALVVNGDRVQDALEWSLAADGAGRRALLGHAVKDLEQVPVRALVFVDRHRS